MEPLTPGPPEDVDSPRSSDYGGFGNAANDDFDDDFNDYDYCQYSPRPRRAEAIFDFIDEVSEGITQYLHYLDEQQKGIVYNRHEKNEQARWHNCIRQVCAYANQRAQSDAAERGDGPRDGPTLLGRLEGGRGPDAGLGACGPPRGLQFTPPGAFQDGRPRLAFSGCFESGNLAYAKSESPTLYTLLLDFDVNTGGYTQWFYFGVQGGHQGLRVTFRIANMSKGSSLFGSHGMQPVVWSERGGRGWERGCSDIRYYYSDRRPEAASNAAKGSCYTLSFTYTFEHDDDTVFFAYHYPYTYSYLQDFLSALSAHPYASRFLRRSTLCKTIGGIACDLLEIKEPHVPENADPNDVSERPVAVVTARVHPGESNASWMMQGFIQFLCSPAPDAQALRRAYDWLVVPMLNPDGVIQGNYRCGLAGRDLNRVFMHPHRRLHPEVWNLRDMLRGRSVHIYLDFHGHSKYEGIFFYGGCFSSDEVRNAHEKNAHVQLLPCLAALSSDDFDHRHNKFSVQESKLGTARLVAFLKLGALRSYTVEASFMGLTAGGDRCGRGGEDEEEEEDEDEEEAEGRKLGRPGASANGAPVVRVFTPARLELAGPAIGRALATCCRFEMQAEEEEAASSPWADPVATAADDGAAGVPGLFGGDEAAQWPHLHYNRLTSEMAHLQFARLLQQRRQGDDDGGSDSYPSADEKPQEELKAIHKRILRKLNKRRRKIPPPVVDEPKVEYRAIVAFGKTLQIPLKPAKPNIAPGEGSSNPSRLGSVHRSVCYVPSVAPSKVPSPCPLSPRPTSARGTSPRPVVLPNTRASTPASSKDSPRVSYSAMLGAAQAAPASSSWATPAASKELPSLLSAAIAGALSARQSLSSTSSAAPGAAPSVGGMVPAAAARATPAAVVAASAIPAPVLTGAAASAGDAQSAVGGDAGSTSDGVARWAAGGARNSAGEASGTAAGAPGSARSEASGALAGAAGSSRSDTNGTSAGSAGAAAGHRSAPSGDTGSAYSGALGSARSIRASSNADVNGTPAVRHIRSSTKSDTVLSQGSRDRTTDGKSSIFGEANNVLSGVAGAAIGVRSSIFHDTNNVLSGVAGVACGVRNALIGDAGSVLNGVVGAACGVRNSIFGETNSVLQGVAGTACGARGAAASDASGIRIKKVWASEDRHPRPPEVSSPTHRQQHGAPAKPQQRDGETNDVRNFMNVTRIKPLKTTRPRAPARVYSKDSAVEPRDEVVSGAFVLPPQAAAQPPRRPVSALHRVRLPAASAPPETGGSAGQPAQGRLASSSPQKGPFVVNVQFLDTARQQETQTPVQQPPTPRLPQPSAGGEDVAAAAAPGKGSARETAAKAPARTPRLPPGGMGSTPAAGEKPGVVTFIAEDTVDPSSPKMMLARGRSSTPVQKQQKRAPVR